ncbi:MAG: radical SAM protein [Pseudomonadota bacterium]
MPEECRSCRLKEEHQEESRRNYYKKKIEPKDQPKIQFLDPHLGNRCNLKCRMCNPVVSSRWGEDARLQEMLPFPMNGFGSQGLVDPINEPFLDWMSTLQDLRFLVLKGGEPFLHPKLSQVLEKIQNPQRVTIQIITNGTIYDASILKRLAKFYRVKLFISVEATGSLYRYIRGGPYSFEDVIANGKKIYGLLPNLGEFGFLYTSNIYGIFDFDRTQQTIDAHFKGLSPLRPNQQVLRPAFLSPLVLRYGMRALLAKNISSIRYKRFLLRDAEDTLGMDGIQMAAERLKFLKYTQALDSLRQEHLLHVEPRFGPLLQAIENEVSADFREEHVSF